MYLSRRVFLMCMPVHSLMAYTYKVLLSVKKSLNVPLSILF